MFENNEYQPHPQNSLKWWGEQHFEINQSKAWQFGSMLFRLTRGIKEWRIEYYRPTLQDDNEQDFHNYTEYNNRKHAYGGAYSFPSIETSDKCPSGL